MLKKRDPFALIAKQRRAGKHRDKRRRNKYAHRKIEQILAEY